MSSPTIPILGVANFALAATPLFAVLFASLSVLIR